MVKVIETNISLNDMGEFHDFQSRVIEVESWEDFINEIKEAKTVIRTSILGNLHGLTIPRESRIENFKCDDRHLSCVIITSREMKSNKLCYLI